MAITNDKRVIHRGLEFISEMPADGAIHAGALLTTASGVVKMAAATPTTLVCAGVALESAADGEMCRFMRSGQVVALKALSGLAYGDVCYVSDNETVQAFATTTNEVRVGTVLESHESEADTVWVKLDPTA